MRATLLGLACVVALAGCAKTNKCAPGTTLVTVTFDAIARAADRLDVEVQLDQQTTMSASIAGPGGHDSGTIEVQFPHGYQPGATLQVSINASLGGQVVASGSATTVLSAGCSTLTVSVTSSGGGDGGAADLAMADMLVLPVPAVSAKPDLVGFTTTLDGSGTSDPLGSSVTLTWAVQHVPAGSTITTASLASTSATKTKFDPDRGGIYDIALTATTTDGRSATLVTPVTVPTAPLFYARVSESSTTSTFGAHVINSDGTGDHAIGCDTTSDGGVTISSLQTIPFAGHAYEPTMGSTTPPLFVFLAGDPANPSAPELVVGSTSTNCTTMPPARIDNNVFNDHFPVSARFSPDGKRVVYVDAPQNSNTGTYRLVTTPVDGVGAKHVIRSDGFFGFTPAIWLDNSTVAWLERDTSSFNPFTIFKAPDENAAGDPGANTKRTAILRCDPSTTSTHLGEINQFEISPFGMIVAASTTPRSTLDNPPLSAVSLYKLADGDCSTTTAKTLALESVGGLAWDFAISPDGLTLLFSSTAAEAIPDGGAPEPQTDIYLVPADGTAAAQKFAGDPLYDDTSPRFIAGGRQFIWTRAPRHLDMGADAPAIMIANADGSHVRSYTPTVAAGETLIAAEVGANRSFDCSWTPGVAPSSALPALLAIAALILLAVRKRRAD